MENKIKAFLSSTFTDLQEYREAVRLVLRRMGISMVALEDFGATGAPPVETIFRAIATSDVFILVVAHRYGYIPKGENESILEQGYKEALRLQKPILVFLLDETQPWSPKYIDTGDGATVLRSFKRRLQSAHIVSFFKTPEDLAFQVARSISGLLGVITPITVETDKTKEVTLNDLMNEIGSLKRELSVLQQIVTQPSQTTKIDSREEDSGSHIKPADFLGAASKSVNLKQCFIIMPYSERWSAGLEKILREICESVGIAFIIAKTMDGRFIPYDIWQGITGSGVMIADLSGANPNVTYEIGLADVLGREVVLICQGDKVPFDFLGQRLILYEDSITGTLKLREELSDRLNKYLSRSINNDSGI